jgi:methylenetetrahydrofolate--tRNA-(uracil-5-)-methyltransferase
MVRARININCPLNEKECHIFYQALIEAEQMPLKNFEKISFFEGCLPIEIIAERGKETLCFGPMKPVGLIDPHSKKQPYAIV